jgi:hypothetical protein
MAKEAQATLQVAKEAQGTLQVVEEVEEATLRVRELWPFHQCYASFWTSFSCPHVDVLDHLFYLS